MGLRKKSGPAGKANVKVVAWKQCAAIWAGRVSMRFCLKGDERCRQGIEIDGARLG